MQVRSENIKKKLLVVNADDFGLDANIDRGIFESFDKGVVSSVSIVANGSTFDSALSLIKKSNKDLGVGVHLSLLSEKPVLSLAKIPSLVNKQGYFFNSIFDLIMRIYLSWVDLSEIEKELESQINKVLDYGITPTHLDGDRFVHILPPVFNITVKLAKKYSIKYIRYPYRDSWMPFLSSSNILKMVFLGLFAKKQTVILKQNNIRYVDCSYGFMASGHIDRIMFLKLLRNLGPELSDINFHPGYRPTCGKYDLWKYDWQSEKNLLCDLGIKEFIKRLNIELVNYAG